MTVMEATMTATVSDDLALDMTTVAAQCASTAPRVERRLSCGHYVRTRSVLVARCATCSGARLGVVS